MSKTKPSSRSRRSEASGLRALFAHATRFTFREGRLDEIRVERRSRRIRGWAVCVFGYVLDRDGSSEHEPLPSSRDAAFLRRTRFTLARALRLAGQPDLARAAAALERRNKPRRRKPSVRTKRTKEKR